MTLFAVELNCADLFVSIMIFAAEIIADHHEIDSAFAICQQLLQFCDYNHLDRPKIRILELIGSICGKQRKFELAIQMLAKAVEVCWVVHEPTLELQIYDKIGYYYYMLGELQSAAFFHSRFIAGKVEPERSTRKKTAIQFNRNVKFVEAGARSCDITFQNLHIFGFSREYYELVKNVMADSPVGMRRLYKLKTDGAAYFEEYSEHFSKVVEGFCAYHTQFEDMDTLQFTLLRAENLSQALADYISEKIPLRKSDAEDDLVTSINNQEANLQLDENADEVQTSEAKNKVSFLVARPPDEIDRAQLKNKTTYQESTLERSIRLQYKAYLKEVGFGVVLKKNEDIERKLIKRIRKDANSHEVTVHNQLPDTTGTIKSNIVTAAVSQLRPEYLMTHGTPSRTLSVFHPHVDHKPFEIGVFFGRLAHTAKYIISVIGG